MSDENVKVLKLLKTNNKPIEKEKNKKRVVSEKWTFLEECYTHDYQLTLVNNINSKIEDNSKICKTVVQEITKKIYGYKQQDILKKKYNCDNFITFDNVITDLVKSNLTCYYCNCDIYVLYDISREAKQWSVDRINNSLGHNKDNYFITCLECNLKRRCTRDDKFFFTKQMKIIKENYDNFI